MKPTRSIPSLAGILSVMLFAAGPALAQDAFQGGPPVNAAGPVSVLSAKSWQAMTFADKGRTMCYIQSGPSGSIGQARGRGKAAVMVIQAPDAGARDQVSIVLGFDPRPGKPVAVKIGRKRFTLKKFGVGRAWADTAKLDRQMVDAMKRYDWMVVNAVSAKGEKVQDTYNMSGFGKAYDAAVKACQ